MFKYINLKSNIVVIAIIIAIFALSLYPQQTYAIPNSVLNYQGRLTNSSGNIVADGTYNITFSIYTDSATSGSSWSETQSVPVRNGIFSVILGNINSLNLDFNATSYYLGIKVGSDSEMRPRTQIGAAPFAVNSKKLDGKNAGTKANDILTLNASGEIDIDGAIRSSGGLYITDGSVELPQGSITSSNIADGAITNAKVSDTASIAYSKLNLATSIQGSDLASNIAINTSGALTVSGTFNTTGTFQINSAQLNATATEINNLSGYTGNTNDLNILSGGALAGITSTEFQYLNGVTSAIQGQLDARLPLAGGTMAGAIAMAGNNITNTGTLSFNAVTDTIAGIQNQNLLDLSANETITGAWTFSDDITVADNKDIKSASGSLIQFSTGPNRITLEANQVNFNGLVSITGQVNVDTNITYVGSSLNQFIGYGQNINDGRIEFTRNVGGYDDIVIEDANFIINGKLKGNNEWSGTVVSGAWGGATYSVALSTISTGDLVIITPTTQPVGGVYWVTINNGVGFTVNSDNIGETMGFNWIVIEQ